jgi:hypothetical protein
MQLIIIKLLPSIQKLIKFRISGKLHLIELLLLLMLSILIKALSILSVLVEMGKFIFGSIGVMNQNIMIVDAKSSMQRYPKIALICLLPLATTIYYFLHKSIPLLLHLVSCYSSIKHHVQLTS